MRDGRPLDGCVVGDVGDEAGGSFRAVDCARLKARDSSRQAQGSRELSSHTADARKVGLGRAEVGGGLLCGHWALGPGGKRIPPLGRQARRSNTALGSSSFARATTTDCDLLAARTGPGLWGSSQSISVDPWIWTPWPWPWLPAHPALEPPPTQNGSGSGSGSGPGSDRRLVEGSVSCAGEAASSSEMCVRVLVSAGTK